MHRTGEVHNKEPKKMNFFKKFVELQMLMLQHNAGLTASHPYASSPINWPFLLSGISFWTESTEQKQIYLIGNIVGWWTCAIALSIYIGILGGDLLARRRGIEVMPTRELTFGVYIYIIHLIVCWLAVRNRLWSSAGFFMLIWFMHYFPFFLMNRQLFIHHYLPSHLASALVAGAVLNFLLSETINYPVSIRGPFTERKERQWADLGIKTPIVVAGFSALMIVALVYIAPLTYGTPG